MNLPELSALAPGLRQMAQQILLPHFAQVHRQDKADGSIVTAADLAMQDQVQAFLQQGWPEIPLLGEEMTAQQQQQRLNDSEWLWVLDPLDGTSNFAAGIPYFCVSLALLHKGQAHLSLLYDPVRDECFSAKAGAGAWLNDEALHVPDTALSLNKAIAVIDLKRLSPELAASLAAEPPYASQRNFGSGALDWAWLAAGRYHYYLHGGQKLWDYTGGHLLLREAGGHATTLAREAVPVKALQPRSVVAAISEAAQVEWLQTLQQRLP